MDVHGSEKPSGADRKNPHALVGLRALFAQEHLYRSARRRGQAGVFGLDEINIECPSATLGLRYEAPCSCFARLPARRASIRLDVRCVAPARKAIAWADAGGYARSHEQKTNTRETSALVSMIWGISRWLLQPDKEHDPRRELPAPPLPRLQHPLDVAGRLVRAAIRTKAD
jgi:hypothetical protein